MKTRKWLTLGIAATALLLIPRRSSRQATPDVQLDTDTGVQGNTDANHDAAADTVNKGKDK